MFPKQKLVYIVGILLSLGFTSPDSNLIAAQDQPKTTPVEQVKPLPKSKGLLGTVLYKPSDQESPYFSKLSPQEKETGSLLADYAITGKEGTFIGWFGIVREIEENPSQKQTKLLVEHKYFDGFTDSHILAVSFNGGGDFIAFLSGTGLGIKNLSLVKVYGVVQKEENQTPQVQAEYIRHWDWGAFTFIMPYGEQKGNTEWKKLKKYKGDKIYNPYPDQKYYEDRLGLRNK